jgi:lysophospholipase L1-like esterase
MRRVVFTLVSLLVSLVIASLVLEGGVLLLAGEQPKFPRRVVGANFGLRDKPPGVKRIVSLGDSYTVGYEVEADETFAAVLERKLVEAGVNVEVLNAGVSGYSNAEECLYLERELLGYAPDLVLVSFYVNDLVDNYRSGLFRLENGVLAEAAQSYVPGGGLGNYLNTNPLFSWLSGYSNAFALLKEAATQIAKRQMVKENLAQVAHASGAPAADDTEGSAPERELAAAIFDRIWRTTQARGIPLLIQSIPIPNSVAGPTALVDTFPLAEFDVNRPGLVFFSAKEALDPYVGKDKLYWTRSHGHWTPLAHRLDGEALARIVLERDLLDTAARSSE